MTKKRHSTLHALLRVYFIKNGDILYPEHDSLSELTEDVANFFS